jgi:succinate dehydrogenase/fumarate reductase flavoprotein subunit
VMADNVAKRGITVVCDATACRLLPGPGGEVTGVEVLRLGSVRRVGARRGVVLACGGFEANREMQRQYWHAGPVASAAYRFNTGDGIRMGQAFGAELWHMWHYHGSYGYHHPDPAYPYAIRVKRLPDWQPGNGRALPRMAWILLDRRGRRFMNEYEPYMQDTGHRPLGVFDPASQDHPRIPAFLVVDEAGRRLYPLGRPTYNDPEVAFDWSDDNLAEVALGIFTRAPSVAELAAVVGAPPEAAAAAIERWNALCRNGADEDFGRPPASMAALETPPFYVARVHPLVSNTQGGLVHDCLHRVLRVDGEPIGRLFAAGEITSVFGHLYMSGGNLAECFVGGRIAGQAAAGLDPW